MSVYIEYFRDAAIPRMDEIISTLWVKPSILWAVIPLLITVILVQIYFGRHRTEELGWNTAFGNTISLFWVSANLIRHTAETYTLEQLLYENFLWLKLVIVSIVAFWAMILAIFNFAHMIPKKISFFVSSTSVVITTAIIVTLIIIGDITIDKVTLVAALILFFIALIILYLIKKLITPSTGAKISMKLHRLHVEEEKKRKRENRKRRIEEKKESIRGFFKGWYNWFKNIF